MSPEVKHVLTDLRRSLRELEKLGRNVEALESILSDNRDAVTKLERAIEASTTATIEQTRATRDLVRAMERMQERAA